MSRGRSPEPLDFFIWTVEDVGLWLEQINLGGYRQAFEENGVNGEYLESLSMFTTEQILRFIRRCHMKWGDFITLCKELRRIKVCLSERGAGSPQAVVGTVMPVSCFCEGGQAEPTVPSCLPEVGSLIRSLSATSLSFIGRYQVVNLLADRITLPLSHDGFVGRCGLLYHIVPVLNSLECYFCCRIVKRNLCIFFNLCFEI
ncbi:hypothetical protein ACP4OV_002064 [Aristida adscensionis]